MLRLARLSAVAALAAVLTPAQVSAQWLPALEPPRGGVMESRIALGLREALTVGAENAVLRTGREDGFFRNEVIKILMPERLRFVETGLRSVGYGAKVDEFILAMNRAAERAAASAKPIFLDAIRRISLSDARDILAGGDTAATQYFRGRTEDNLARAFRPIVESATTEFGVTRRYKELLQGLPFADARGLDLDQYVVVKTLDGLFFVLGEEERKIRRDPAARVTAILREVFGR
jgi:hypothetical protein